jgi:hypothetical protein
MYIAEKKINYIHYREEFECELDAILKQEELDKLAFLFSDELGDKKVWHRQKKLFNPIGNLRCLMLDECYTCKKPRLRFQTRDRGAPNGVRKVFRIVNLSNFDKHWGFLFGLWVKTFNLKENDLEDYQNAFLVMKSLYRTRLELVARKIPIIK